jgi:hypothetical protein
VQRGDGFPRWRALWRAYYSTEAALARLPVLLFVPTTAALIGAAWAASHPADEVRNGLIVHQGSFGAALVTALVGGIVGLLVIIALTFVWTLGRYALGGNPTWRAEIDFHYEGGDPPRRDNAIRLVCTARPLAATTTLGETTAALKFPSGLILHLDKTVLVPWETGLVFVPFRGVEPEVGIYEVRWYSTMHQPRWQEVCRARARFDGKETVRL